MTALNKEEEWVITDEEGNVLVRLRCKRSAENLISEYRLNRKDKLKVKYDPIENG